MTCVRLVIEAESRSSEARQYVDIALIMVVIMMMMMMMMIEVQVPDCQ